MEPKQVKDLLEAYSSIYEKKEAPEMEGCETEKPESGNDGGGKHKEGKEKEKEMKEEAERLDEITRSMGRRAREYRRKQEQDAHMASMAAHKEKMENDPEYRRKHEESRTVHQRAHERSQARRNGEGETQKESYDLFDYILEHLVAEGYADTNEAAIAIMANMSEEWKQSIVEMNLSSPLFNRPSNTIPGDSTPRGAVVKTRKPAQPSQPRNPNEGGPGSQNTRPRLTTGQQMRTTPTPRTVKTPR